MAMTTTAQTRTGEFLLVGCGIVGEEWSSFISILLRRHTCQQIKPATTIANRSKGKSVIMNLGVRENVRRATKRDHYQSIQDSRYAGNKKGHRQSYRL